MTFIKFVAPTLEARVLIEGDRLPHLFRSLSANKIDEDLSLFGDDWSISSSPEEGFGWYCEEGEEDLCSRIGGIFFNEVIKKFKGIFFFKEWNFFLAII